MNRVLLPRRRSIRAPAYNYAAPGAYFITVVTQDRSCFFGTIEHGGFCAAPAGAVVNQVWFDLPSRFPSMELDHFVVMPNHVHGVLWLTGASAAQPVSLGSIVGAFKSLATREINAVLVRHGPLWQRNYYERVVRNEGELTAIRRYIDDNPLRWALDSENRER